jgi:hypothetical protein
MSTPRNAMTLSKEGQQMIDLVDMMPNESLVYSIQGDGFFLGSNPAAKAIAKIQATLTSLTGGHIRVLLVVTNKRILMVESLQFFCGWQRLRKVQAIALASIAEAGWVKETQMCCIHTRVAHVESKTQRYSLVIKKLGDEELRQFVSSLSRVIVSNVESRTAV